MIIGIFIFIIVIFVLISWLFISRLSSKVIIPPVLPSNGVQIPIVNAAYGYFLFNVHNNAWCSFKLFADNLQIKILSTTSIPYASLSEIDIKVYKFPLTVDTLVIKLKANKFAYYLSMSSFNLKESLKFLKSKNVPLSENAQKLLNES